MKIESQRIGQYELRQRLHQDAAGETWRAYDHSGQRSVTLKLHSADLLDAEALTTYLEEVERVAGLHQPHLARIYTIQMVAPNQIGNATALACLVMEWVEGETLAGFLQQITRVGKLPPAAEVVHLFTALAMALDSAHQHGIIHGNLKPTNILLGQPTGGLKYMGTPQVADFGPAQFPVKKSGNEIPFYLAPEQVQGKPATAASDVYALGAMLYELYTGTTPFRGNRPVAVMMQHVNAMPTSPDLVNPGISSALAQVILRCLAKDPQARFSTVSALAVALADALHVAQPENLRHFARAQGITLLAAPDQLGTVKDADLSLPPGLHLASAAIAVRRNHQNRLMLLISILSLVVILGVSVGTALLFQMRNASSSQVQNMADPATGRAFFLNSGQINAETTQGINDELEVDVANLRDPAPGKSYYAWLLGDNDQKETSPLLLGRLKVSRGIVHFLYAGNNQHTNLLTFASRFLINEDNTNSPSSDPLLDQDAWRYYASIPQTPDPQDKLHFSMLDHLRHLLVESPELTVRGLHGGLAFWFTRDTSAVADEADMLDRDWQKKDVNSLHTRIVSILDYLDGVASIQLDVPSGTAFLADPQIAHIALLGPAPNEAYAPGYVYQNEPPPGYIYLLQNHLNGALLAPQASTGQHQLSIQINSSIDKVRNALGEIYQDARQLASASNSKLLQTSSLTLLDEIATQARYAYSGQPDPATGALQGGALWIYANLQRLASFELEKYPS